MRTKLAMACALLLISCGNPNDQSGSDSSLNAEHTPAPAFDDRTLDRVSFITSHNAFAKGIRSIAPNQDWDIRTQLDKGVRGFMLDIWSHKGKATLCHTMCEIPIPFLKPDISVSLTDKLRDFQEFMKHDRNAIITLHLEWTPSARVNEFEAALNELPELKNMIFNPYQADVKRNGWPKIRDMISQNKRLLILNQTGATKHLGIGHDREFTVENYWSMGKTASDRSCRTRWDDIPLDRDNDSNNKFRRLFVMNHFRDIPFAGTTLYDNQNDSLWGRISHECLQSARRIPNYIALDFVDKGDGFSILGTLNRAVGVGFEHPHFGGKAQLIVPGNESMNGGASKLDNDTLSSIEIFFRGTRVALFDNDHQKAFLRDIIETTAELGNINDRVSSWRAD